MPLLLQQRLVGYKTLVFHGLQSTYQEINARDKNDIL